MDLQTDVFIELHVPDFDKTFDFYSKLGFEVVWRRNEAEGYMVLRRGRSVLSFYAGTDAVYDQSYFKRFPKDTPRGYGVEIVLFDDDIDRFYQAVEKNISKHIVEKLKLQPWGRKDFRIVDPFGFYIRFVERYDWVNKYPAGSVFTP